jgi:hypothetical protein
MYCAETVVWKSLIPRLYDRGDAYQERLVIISGSFDALSTDHFALLALSKKQRYLVLCDLSYCLRDETWNAAQILSRHIRLSSSLEAAGGQCHPWSGPTRSAAHVRV